MRSLRGTSTYSKRIIIISLKTKRRTLNNSFLQVTEMPRSLNFQGIVPPDLHPVNVDNIKSYKALDTLIKKFNRFTPKPKSTSKW